MAQVFISYSRRDLSFVDRLVQDLGRMGLDVWYDLSGLEGGERWGDKIQGAIRECECVIVVLSPDSVKSEWVEREFLFASNLKKKIVPLMYRECELPFNYLNLNYIDVQGGLYEQNFPKILKAINGGLLAANSGGNSTVRSAVRTISPRPRQSNNTIKYVIGCGVIGLVGLMVVAVAGFWLVPKLFPAGPAAIVNEAIPTTLTPNLIPTTPSISNADITPFTITPTFTPTYTPTPTLTPTVQINLCDQLAQKSLDIKAENGFTGVIGPSGILLIAKGNGSYTFTTIAAFRNEQLDTVSGNCEGNTLTFTRTRPQAFIQDYQADLSKNSSGLLSLDGLLTDRATGQKVKWSGQVTEALTPNGLCDQLAGKSININQTNGFQGIVGPSGIPLIAGGGGSYTFTTVAVYRNEQADPVTGSCQKNTVTFTRTRTNVFIQDFTATISQKSGGILSLDGSITDRESGQSVMWSGQVIAP